MFKVLSLFQSQELVKHLLQQRVINVVDEDSHTPKTDENGFMWDEPHTEDPYVYLANLEDTLILATVEFSLHENSAIGSSGYLSLDPIHSVDI